MSAPPTPPKTPNPTSRTRKILIKKFHLPLATPAPPKTSILEAQADISRRSASIRTASSPSQMSKDSQLDFWGPGVFQCQHHIDVVNKIGKYLEYPEWGDSFWQPADPLELRKVADEELVGRFLDYDKKLLEGDRDKDMILILGVAVFMRLGAKIPPPLVSFVATRLSENPLPPSINLTPYAVTQLQRALQIYKPGYYYMFPGAELEMMGLLAGTQSWEVDIEKKRYEDVFGGGYYAGQPKDLKENGDVKDIEGKGEGEEKEEDDRSAVASLRRIVSRVESVKREGGVAKFAIGIKNIFNLRGVKKKEG
ncbi:hypothetical protein ABW19_dt0208463 [Dactylella cylindrospora]|nr:hypothetical protein ABW19_dt0208463 [Dactylella cylindrospora]